MIRLLLFKVTAKQNMGYLFHPITIIFMVVILFLPLWSYGNSTKYDDTRTAYFRQQLQSDLISTEMRLLYYDSLMYRLPNEKPKLLLGKAKILWNMNTPENNKAAIKLYEDMCNMESFYTISENLENIYILGDLYIKLGDPLKALRLSEKLLSYPIPDSLNYYKVKAYQNLCDIFTYIEDDEKLNSAINKGLTLLESERNKISSELYLRIKSGILMRKASLMYYTEEKYTEAFELYSEIKRIYPPISDIINLSMGGLFGTQKQYDIARQYFMEALYSSSNAEIRAVAAINMVIGYAQMGLYDKMLNFVNQYDSDLKYWNNEIHEATLWGLKSEAYENQGNYREALYAQRMADSIKNEIMPPEKIREIEREYQKISMREKDLEIEELKKNTQKKNTWLWIVGGIGLLLISGLVFMEYKNRKVKLEILKEEEKRKEEEQAHWSEIENWRERQTNLETTLELRNQKMASMAMKLANMSEKMEELKETVSDPKAKKGEIVASVQSMLRGVSADGEVWESFMGYFEGVNQSFFDRLHVLHPDLTNAEIRMCAFILLNRTTKEIATIINRSVRTVETIKYNLRKKLGITESTESYLRSISAGEKQISDNET